MSPFGQYEQSLTQIKELVTEAMATQLLFQKDMLEEIYFCGH